MILTSLLVGAAIIAGGTLIASFWNDIVGWLKRAIQKVSEMIKFAVFGTKVFLRKMGEAIQEISKHYSKKPNNQWVETIVTREVSENEVPPEFRAKAQRNRETDITNELKMELAG